MNPGLNYRSPAAVLGFGSPSRFRLRDSQLARRRGGFLGTQSHWVKINRVSVLGTSCDLQTDRVCELHKTIVRQDPRRAETRYDNLDFHEKAVISADGLRNQ